jgi:tetratricopeptide (TPR) repeat protein
VGGGLHSTLIREALLLDRAGKLDEAFTTIERRYAETPSSVDEQIEGLRIEAKVLRHHYAPAHLARAVAVATRAFRLASLAGGPDDAATGLAALELASCQLAGDEFAGGADAAMAWARHEDASVAGWAWALIGEAKLGLGRHFEAIGALFNAVAEFRRGGNGFREWTARIALAAAFSRAGHLDEAGTILKADRDYWTGSDDVRRTSVAYLLVRAENQQRTGQIGKALRTLDGASKLLRRTSGMGVAKVRMHTQRAACFLEWGQRERAKNDHVRAQSILAEMRATGTGQVASGRRDGTGMPPAASARPVVLAPLNAPTAPPPVVHGRLVSDARSTEADLRSLGVVAVRGRERAASGDLGRMVEDLIADLRELDRATGDAVEVIFRAVGRLQGRAGFERAEVRALVRAGEFLARSAVPEQPDAERALVLETERLLRRAQVRLEHLDAVGLLRARCQVALARVLRRTDRGAEALELAVAGLMGLDAERLHMHQRHYRREWLSASVDLPFQDTIELAMERGREDLAADLIVFSRVAGVVVPQLADDEGRAADVPIGPVPRFVFIDGHESELGSDDVVRFV